LGFGRSTLESLVTLFSGYYRGKRVLVTGHTGFKGGWMSLWLSELGANVTGLALPPEPSPNLYEVIRPGTFKEEFLVDITDPRDVEHAFHMANPDFVFHLAAQPLVRRSHVDPVKTIQTNLIGTLNLLEALRQSRKRVDAIIVSSDKCYANINGRQGHAFVETDPLGGRDPYSMSKAACELLVKAWRSSFFDSDPKLGNIATARSGNVLGGGDYRSDRIMADCARALGQRQPVLVRNPHARRPWQYVLDCMSGYLWLGAKLGQSEKGSAYASAYNFGPGPQGSQTVTELVEEVLKSWSGTWLKAAEPAAPHETTELRLSIAKAADKLGWRPTWALPEAVKTTVAWYRRRHETGDKDLRSFSLSQIADFSRAATQLSQPWTLPLSNLQ
jgi:CDP-glucose 4,6-dehydratase